MEDLDVPLVIEFIEISHNLHSKKCVLLLKIIVLYVDSNILTGKFCKLF